MVTSPLNAQRLRIAALAIAIAFGGFTMAHAQVQASDTIHLTGEIVSVDQKTRHVTVRGADGRQETVEVGPEVRNLDKVKAGDQVNVEYTRSLLLQLETSGSVGATASESVERAAKGSKPGAAGARRVVTTSKVIAVDTKENTITLQSPQGDQYTLGVMDPKWQERLKKVKPGQFIKATYDEGLAVSVTPKS